MLTYENALLARAMITGGTYLGAAEMVHIGCRVLDWLIEARTASDGYLTTIGNQGWWPRDGVRSAAHRGDGQRTPHPHGRGPAVQGQCSLQIPVRRRWGKETVLLLRVEDLRDLTRAGRCRTGYDARIRARSTPRSRRSGRGRCTRSPHTMTWMAATAAICRPGLAELPEGAPLGARPAGARRWHSCPSSNKGGSSMMPAKRGACPDHVPAIGGPRLEHQQVIARAWRQSSGRTPWP